MATFTPSAASDRAACRPSPLLPPVTSAFLPAIPISIGYPPAVMIGVRVPKMRDNAIMARYGY